MSLIKLGDLYDVDDKIAKFKKTDMSIKYFIRYSFILYYSLTVFLFCLDRMTLSKVVSFSFILASFNTQRLKSTNSYIKIWKRLTSANQDYYGP